MKRSLPFQTTFITLGLLLLMVHANAQTITEFVFRNPVLISGIADQDGAVYKFTNVAPGVDANVTVMGRSGPEVFLDTIDIPLSNGMGYDRALQPQVGLHGTAPANTSWWLKFKVNFLKAGTNKKATMTNFVASAIDVDGDNLSIAENIKMFQANAVTTSISSVLTSILPATAICPNDHLPGTPVDCGDCDGKGYIVKSNGSLQNCGKCNNTGKIFLLCRHPWIGSDIQVNGTSFNALGIDTLAVNNMATFSYANTDEVIFSYGATTGAAASSAGQRLNSLWFKSFNYSMSSLLPLRLMDFTAVAQQSGIMLNWSTTAEKGFSHFILERSTDGLNFKECAMIYGSSNTEAISYYKYKDQAFENVHALYYRLKMVDVSAHASYSGIKVVSINTGKTTATMTAYPNPAKEQVYITIPTAWTGKKAVAAIYNTAGILVKNIQLNAVNQTENLDVSQLTKGLYTINISCQDTSLQARIIKN
ncbi:MAG: T9SS type A sorting domain-containing protein [Chitinophagaceae bacterium]